MRYASHDRWLDPAGADPPSSARASITLSPFVAHPAPASADALRSLAPERYDVGRRPHASEAYVVSRDELEPLAHLRYRSGRPLTTAATHMPDRTRLARPAAHNPLPGLNPRSAPPARREAGWAVSPREPLAFAHERC